MIEDPLDSVKIKTPPKKNIQTKQKEVDLSNPLFKIPFRYGWRREVVHRQVQNQHNNRQSDVYYFSPDNKKFRSKAEIEKSALGKGLMADHFTFSKKLIGVDDPEAEYEREAKIRPVKQKTFSEVKKQYQRQNVEDMCTSLKHRKNSLSGRSGSRRKQDCVQCLAAKSSRPKKVKTYNRLVKSKLNPKLNLNTRRFSKGPKNISKGSRYFRPFKAGWKRVAVRKYHSDPRIYYVYYISPSGRHCKTCKSLLKEFGNADLNLNDFTFVRRLLGAGPGKEYSRIKSTKYNTKETIVKLRECYVRLDPLKDAEKFRVISDISLPAEPNYYGPVSEPEDDSDDNFDNDFSNDQSMEEPPEVKFSNILGANIASIPEFILGKNNLEQVEKKCNNVAKPTNRLCYKDDVFQKYIDFHESIYNAYYNIFKYLKLSELMRAREVSKVWKRCSENPMLWDTICFENMEVKNWEKFVTFLCSKNSKILDLRKFSADEDYDWEEFLSAISKATCLKEIYLCKCPPFVIENIIEVCPFLHKIILPKCNPFLETLNKQT